MSYNVGQTVLVSLTFTKMRCDAYRLEGKTRDFVWAYPGEMLENQPECLRPGDKVSLRGQLIHWDSRDNTFQFQIPSRSSVFAKLWIKPDEIIAQDSQAQPAPQAMFKVGDKVTHKYLPGVATITKLYGPDKTRDYEYLPNGVKGSLTYQGQWYEIQFCTGRQWSAPEINLLPAPATKFQVGDTVYHTQMREWGKGTVTKIASPRDNALDYTRPGCEFRHYFDGTWYHVSYENRDKNYISAEDLLTTTPPTRWAKFYVDDEVFQMNMPEWGIGRVVEILPGPRRAKDYVRNLHGVVIEQETLFSGPWYKVEYPNRSKRYISAEDLLKPGSAFVPPAKFAVGDKVIQYYKPEWGVGTVVEVLPGPRTAEDYCDVEDEFEHAFPGAWYKVAYALRDKRYISAEDNLVSAGI